MHLQSIVAMLSEELNLPSVGAKVVRVLAQTRHRICEIDPSSGNISDSKPG
jgi:hypothetical protein